MRSKTRYVTCVLGIFAFAYFVIYPSDIETLIAPLATLVSAVTGPGAELLGLSKSVSPWLYATAIAGILAWTATRLWSKPTQAPSKRKQQPSG